MHMFARFESLAKQIYGVLGSNSEPKNKMRVHSRSLESDSRSVVEHALTRDQTWSGHGCFRSISMSSLRRVELSDQMHMLLSGSIESPEIMSGPDYLDSPSWNLISNRMCVQF
jgi:hypothetical protein